MDNKILIVEDEEKLAELVKLRLSLEGFNCDIAHHTVPGIKAFSSGMYDLLILDLMVPGGGGLKILEHREENNLEDIPVIVVTGQALTPALRTRLQEAGVSAIMSKPYDPTQFSAIIKRCINNSKGVCHEYECV